MMGGMPGSSYDDGSVLDFLQIHNSERRHLLPTGWERLVVWARIYQSFRNLGSEAREFDTYFVQVVYDQLRILA